jgi:murein DD-endopeptidase MepM/ murein hydrolase activator NlpD
VVTEQPEDEGLVTSEDPAPPVENSLIQMLADGPREPAEPEPAPESAPRQTGWWLSAVGWLIAAAMIVVVAYVWQLRGTTEAVSIQPTLQPTARPTATLPSSPVSQDIGLPEFKPRAETASVFRLANPHTIIPTRPRSETVAYVVDFGDSVFGIAQKFNIEPETVLWANYDLLNDNPDFLEPGMELNIPPIDGVYYQWQDGDSLAAVAAEFEAEVDEILSFSGNQLDLTNPEISVGNSIMIPGGRREFRQWLIPTIARGNAGVNAVALGPGACTGSYEGAYGSGAFIWPANNHFLSGNDYWSGHLGIDIAAGEGVGIYASDAGVVVFSGWANGGYGYTVMVDHGNGYQTLYAHLSAVTIPCGASVGPGTTVGLAGSTGNSTGAHLHFEVRFNGGFINPWFVLPAP